jgi:hypothetical protein
MKQGVDPSEMIENLVRETKSVEMNELIFIRRLTTVLKLLAVQASP